MNRIRDETKFDPLNKSNGKLQSSQVPLHNKRRQQFLTHLELISGKLAVQLKALTAEMLKPKYKDVATGEHEMYSLGY